MTSAWEIGNTKTLFVPLPDVLILVKTFITNTFNTGIPHRLCTADNKDTREVSVWTFLTQEPDHSSLATAFSALMSLQDCQEVVTNRCFMAPWKWFFIKRKIVFYGALKKRFFVNRKNCFFMGYWKSDFSVTEKIFLSWRPEKAIWWNRKNHFFMDPWKIIFWNTKKSFFRRSIRKLVFFRGAVKKRFFRNRKNSFFMASW